MEAQTILQLHHISKLYPGVIALNDVSMDFKAGEIHAIVGENGAGKSTLIKAISGAIAPSAGTIEINGQTFEKMTPSLSRHQGIAVIYQEFTLIPVLTAAENIFMGEFLMKGMVLDQKKMEQKASELFARLKVSIDPKVKVADLTTGYQQIVEITKAVSKNAKVLIMDEPSAPLTTLEVEALFTIVDTLKSQGVTIIYISHRLEEIFRLSDRISVMRDGHYVKTLATASTNTKELIQLMVGRDLNENYPPRDFNIGETILSLCKVSGNGVKDISFDVKKGEILGLAGLIGAGRTELAQLLFGHAKMESGEVILNGKTIVVHSPQEAIAQGIALVPEDRKRQGLILDMTIKENTTLPSLVSLSFLSAISKEKEKKMTQTYITSLRIKTPSQAQKAKNLSGGNQQKIVLAKWLATMPQIMIFDEPTRGIDVGAKYEIYLLMNEFVQQGKTLLMISSEMEELIGMSDRIVVLSKGRLQTILEKNQFKQETILEYSAGGKWE